MTATGQRAIIHVTEVRGSNRCIAAVLAFMRVTISNITTKPVLLRSSFLGDETCNLSKLERNEYDNCY